MSLLDDFLGNYGETESPALYSTVRGISQINEESDVPIAKLADLIRTDASMTAHVLRHTQGAYRIPLKGKHNTVNRAIVMLGFREVRALCLTVCVLEGLSSRNASEAFVGELGRVFHGAIQARSIALLKGERSCEEVFTTALLNRIGHLMFWASGDSRIEILYNAYEGRSPDQYSNIEKAVLGFTLAELSTTVMNAWGLDEYCRQPNATMNEKEKIRFDASDLGMEFAKNASQGWESPEMKEMTSKISIYLDLPKDIIQGTLKENTIMASQFAESFNVPGLSEEIKKTLTIESVSEDRILDEKSLEELSEATFDPAFQLKILSEIGASLESGVDINKIIGMTLEGIYRGVGFERVLFALLTPNRKQLRGKAGFGKCHKLALENLKIDIEEESNSVFSQCLKDGISMWLPDGLTHEPNVPVVLKKSLMSDECILVPLVVSGRSIGIFYADKVSKNKTITENEFTALKQFVFQIKLALGHIQRSSRSNNAVIPLKVL